MKQQLNEVKRMQQLAGIIVESQIKENNILSLKGGTIIYKGPTEQFPRRDEIYHTIEIIDKSKYNVWIPEFKNDKPILTKETTKEQQQEIAKLLGKGEQLKKQYVPSELADVLGYYDVQELAEAIAKKIGAKFESKF